VNFSKKVAIFSIFIFSIFIFLFGFNLISGQKSGVKPTQVGIDFALFYAAGQLAHDGLATDVYNISLHHAAIEKLLNVNIPFLLAWFYPPTFLLFIVPFTLLTYNIALLLWLILTLLAALLAAFLLVPKMKHLAFVVLGFPGVLMNIRWGQNGFLSTALLGFGLYFLEANPILSGLMFGFLAYKPQIAAFPFILLLLSRKWKVLFWSIVFALLIAVLSGFIFGFSTWMSFFSSFFGASGNIIRADWNNVKAIQPSLYSFLKLINVNTYLTYIILSAIAVSVLITASWIWLKTDNLTLIGSAMVIGTLLSAPYYLQYDLMILSLPILLLSYDFFEHGFRNIEFFLLICLWLLPIVNWPLVLFTGIQICPFILAAIFIMTFYRVKRQIFQLHQVK
jgi:hypothetical protein